MRSNEVVPILPKYLPSSSTPPPRAFFLAYLPRILAWCLTGFILVTWFNWVGVSPPEDPQPPDTQPFVLPTYISHNLGAYTPWYPVQRYRSPPKECEVTQVSSQLDSDGRLSCHRAAHPVRSFQETDYYHRTRSLSLRSIW